MCDERKGDVEFKGIFTFVQRESLPVFLWCEMRSLAFTTIKELIVLWKIDGKI